MHVQMCFIRLIQVYVKKNFPGIYQFHVNSKPNLKTLPPLRFIKPHQFLREFAGPEFKLSNFSHSFAFRAQPRRNVNDPAH